MSPFDDRSPDSRSAPDASGDAQFVQGKWVILVVVGLAVMASVVSWIYYARLQRRPLELWGPRAAELMLRAPVARAYRLVPAKAEPSGEVGRRFEFGGVPYTAIAERSVSQAPGFSHIRQGLVHDRSFAWDDVPCDEPAHWEYAVEFEDRGATAVVAFDFHCGRAMLAGSERSESIRPVAAAVEGFLREQFPAADQTPAAK